MKRFSILLLFALPIQSAVTGLVVRDDGKPLSGAAVRAFARVPMPAMAERLLANETPSPIASATTSDDGKFTLDVKGTPTVDLLIEAAGMQPAGLPAADRDDAGAIVMRAGGRTLRITADGKPLASASLLAANGIALHADAQGRVPRLPFGSFVIVAPDYAIASGADVSGDEVKISRGVAVQGKVVDAKGAAVGGAAVSMHGITLAHSAPDGTFTIAHAPSQWRTIEASSGSMAGMVSNGAKIEIRLRPAASLSGAVSSTNGPLAGARLDLGTQRAGVSQRSAITDAKGRYAFDGLAPGQYTLTLSHPAYAMAHVPELNLGKATTRDFRLAPLARISGTVISEDRKPVAGAIVTTARSDAGSTLSDANGAFSLRVFGDPAPAMLLVAKEGFATKSYGPQRIEPGTTKSGVAITLQRGFPLQVKVVDPIAPACPTPTSSSCRATRRRT